MSSTLKSKFFRIFVAPLPVTNFIDMLSKLFAIAMSLVTWPNPIGLEKKSKSIILVQNSDQISRLFLVSKFKWFSSRNVSGLMVQIGYDVALTRRKSRVQIPVGPFLASKYFD